jgi:hypothetical protein
LFAETKNVNVRNSCRSLPRGAIKQVKRALDWIHPVDLEGIVFVQLMDEMPEELVNTVERRRHARKEGFSFNGIYMSKLETEPAHIMLFIRDIYRGIPKIFELTTVPTLLICRTLAHEVGHHLVAKQGYIFQPDERYGKFDYEEEMANRYAFRVLKRMNKRWYYKLGSWLSRRIASFHFVGGLADWEQKKYESAAERWYRTWLLDPDREDAVTWYWHAKKVIEGVEVPRTIKR